MFSSIPIMTLNKLYFLLAIVTEKLVWREPYHNSLTYIRISQKCFKWFRHDDDDITERQTEGEIQIQNNKLKITILEQPD